MPALDVLDPLARRALYEVLNIASKVASPGADVGRAEEAALHGASLALGVALSPFDPRAASFEALPLGELSPRDRMLVYVAAAWMVLADGVRLRAESELLEELRTHLALDGATARFLERQARWVRTSTGDRPLHRELDHLLTETARRLAAIAARQAA